MSLLKYESRKKYEYHCTESETVTGGRLTRTKPLSLHLSPEEETEMREQGGCVLLQF